MESHKLRHFATLAIAALLLFVIGTANAQRTPEPLAEAKQQIDTYYGDKGQLERATNLLTKALSMDPQNAEVYVQAARLTIKGGHVVSTRFRPGTVEAYDELLDMALALDAKNQKAHILKAEVHNIRNQFREEKLSLDRAKTLGDADPWLLMGYGRYHLSIGDPTNALYFFMQVVRRGPGQGHASRNAYVESLGELARFNLRPEDGLTIQDLGRMLQLNRHPKDAWSLGNFAQQLLWRGLFDDAISFAREALQTMDYGAARLTLAAALYGKAADLLLQNREEQVHRLVSEASSFGFTRERILQKLAGESAEALRRAPVLEQIVK